MGPVGAIISELVAAGLCGDRLLEAVHRLESAGVFGVTGAQGFVTPRAPARVRVVAPRGRPGNADSAGARRTRLYRMRRASQGGAPVAVSGFVTGFVTPAGLAQEMNIPAKSVEFAGVTLTDFAADSVTNRPETPETSQTPAIVTPAAAKENPPTPPIRKYSPKAPQGAGRHKPASRRRQRSQFEAYTPLSPAELAQRPFVLRSTPLFLELVHMLRDRGIAIPDHGDRWWFARSDVEEAQARLDQRVTALPVRAEKPRAGEDDQQHVQRKEARS